MITPSHTEELKVELVLLSNSSLPSAESQSTSILSTQFPLVSKKPFASKE